jgi:molybdopterin converting factor subunit 1
MTLAVAVRLRYFARLRELAGTDSETLDDVPVGSTLGDVYAGLKRIHPALPDRDTVRVAINQEFSDWNSTVSQGDEVAFIPPVSGGL